MLLIRRLTTPILLALLLGLGPTLASAASLESFFGTWSASSGDAGENALNVTFRESDDGGFRAGFALPKASGNAVKRLDVTFEPSGKPGVFVFLRGSGSILGRLFASPTAGNPLARETLLWARLADEALILYSLTVDQGGEPVLTRLSFRQDGDGLLARRSVRSGIAPPEIVERRLARGTAE